MLDLPDPDNPVVHVHTRAHGGLGTLSRRALDARVHAGEVAPDDLFWISGLTEWCEIRHHPELFDDLAPVSQAPSGSSEVMDALTDRPGPRPVETLEPELLDSPGHTVASVGHPSSPTPPAPSAAFSLAEDESVSFAHRTWVPEPIEEEPIEEELTEEEPIEDEPTEEEPIEEEPHSWHELPPDADALVPTDTALGFDDESEADENEFPAPSPLDPVLEAVFTELLEATWDYQEAHEFAGCVDEVFLGAIMTSVLDAGRLLIDLSSDGTHHFLRFEHPEDNSRVLLRLTHLTGNLTTSRVQGHMASVVVGYGERVSGFGDIWARLSSEPRSGLVPREQPGALVADGDVASQYVYVQVRLYLRIDDYVAADWSIDHDRLRDHLSACVRSLRAHLYGRLR